MYAQLFIGTASLVCDVEGMKTDKQFINTLEDNIRHCGAPTKLIPDSAKVEISQKVKDILCALCISDWQSEPALPAATEPCRALVPNHQVHHQHYP
jgi:hypothetical protein